MPDGVSLEADCANCAALCCVCLAFDKSENFAIDKANGVVCPNLGDNNKCSIHSGLETKGFSGCVRYTCNGAGQHVTQKIFDGKFWQDDGVLLRPMMEAFSTMCRVHELEILLRVAQKLPLPADISQNLKNFHGQINPAKGWNLTLLKEFDTRNLDKKIRQFLRTLGPYTNK